MELQNKSDAELMEAIAAGDRDSLAELVRRYQDDVLRLAYRLLQRWDEAEDVAQEAFLRVQRSAGRYRPYAAFRTWLYRIVVNLSLDTRRRRRHQRHTDALAAEREPSADCQPQDEMQRRERQERVRRAIAALPERQRVALVLHRYHEVTYRQIAEVTGWSESAVESLIVRAFSRLRQTLSEQREELSG